MSLPDSVRADLRALLRDFLNPAIPDQFLRPDYGVSVRWFASLGFSVMPAWAKRTSEKPHEHNKDGYYWFTREEVLDGMAELHGQDAITEFLLELEQ